MDTLANFMSKCKIIDHMVILTVIMAILVLELGPGVDAATYKTYYMEDYCKDNSSQIKLEPGGIKSAAVVRASRYKRLPDDFPDNNCTVQVVAPKNYQVVVSVRAINLKRKEDKDQKTCVDFLQIGYGPKNRRRYCMVSENKAQRKALTSVDQNFVILFLKAKCSEGRKGFEITITAVTSAGNCDEEEFFKCSNGNCIAEDLVCDRRNNCGDLSDESGTRARCAQRFSPLVVVILLVLAILIVGAIFLVAIYIKRRRFSPSNYGRSGSTAYQLSDSPYAPTTTPVEKKLTA